MARKSRKHPELAVPVSKNTVGYIRLSVLNRDHHGSVENRRLMIEEWGHQHQIPITRYYIDDGFSGKHFDRSAFQEMLQDIQKGEIDCIVVKDLSRLGRDYITVGYYLEVLFPCYGLTILVLHGRGNYAWHKETGDIGCGAATSAFRYWLVHPFVRHSLGWKRYYWKSKNIEV